LNAAIRVRSGLRLLGGETITPDVPTDLYHGLMSVYRFFSEHAEGPRVLDIGCGPGFGTAMLADNGFDVVGVDIDPKNVRFATRRYGSGGARFELADAQALPATLGGFDTVVSSNCFEHLDDVDAALDGVERVLRPDGRFLLVVPPIWDETDRRVHDAIDYHRNAFAIPEWRRRLGERFDAITAWRHGVHEGPRLDFLSPFPTSNADRFWIAPAPANPSERYETLGAVFSATRRG
jgi:SAM-dependent methyltransferase